MSLSAADRAQLVRQAVLEFLATRQSLVYTVADIVDRVQNSNLLDFRAEADEITAAIIFLEDLKLVGSKRAALGRTLYYQATSAGVLAFERGTLE
jgi:hypothetical protein